MSDYDNFSRLKFLPNRGGGGGASASGKKEDKREEKREVVVVENEARCALEFSVILFLSAVEMLGGGGEGDFYEKAELLRAVRVDELRSHHEKISFWLNVSQTLFLHGLVTVRRGGGGGGGELNTAAAADAAELRAGDVADHVRDVYGLAYNVGGYRVTLEEIQRNLLTRNELNCDDLDDGDERGGVFRTKDPRRKLVFRIPAEDHETHEYLELYRRVQFLGLPLFVVTHMDAWKRCLVTAISLYLRFNLSIALKDYTLYFSHRNEDDDADDAEDEVDRRLLAVLLQRYAPFALERSLLELVDYKNVLYICRKNFSVPVLLAPSPLVIRKTQNVLVCPKKKKKNNSADLVPKFSHMKNSVKSTEKIDVLTKTHDAKPHDAKQHDILTKPHHHHQQVPSEYDHLMSLPSHIVPIPVHENPDSFNSYLLRSSNFPLRKRNPRKK